MGDTIQVPTLSLGNADVSIRLQEVSVCAVCQDDEMKHIHTDKVKNMLCKWSGELVLTPFPSLLVGIRLFKRTGEALRLN